MLLANLVREYTSVSQLKDEYAPIIYPLLLVLNFATVRAICAKSVTHTHSHSLSPCAFFLLFPVFLIVALLVTR